MGITLNSGTSRASSPPAGLQRYRVIVAFVLTAIYVAIKAMAHDYWSVGFGLALLGVIVLSPESPEGAEPWRQHALRVVSACFVVVTLASIWSTISAH